MQTDSLVGGAVVILALAFIVYLVAWSRRAIEKIAARDLRSVRDIVRELKDEE